MTYQPPPPPPGQAGPPPSGNYPSQGGGFDPKSVNPLDWGILGAGALAFIFSLFDYYSVSYSGRGYDVSEGYSAWHGFFGWFGALVALIGAGLVAVTLFAPQTKLPFPARLAGLGAFAVATLCVILALFVVPDGGAGDFPGVDDGHGFGYWASLIVIIAGLVLSLMRLQQTGGQLPGALANIPNLGARGPQGGISGGQQSRPAPGYGNQPPPPPGYGNQPPPPPGYGNQPPPPPPPGYQPPASQ